MVGTKVLVDLPIIQIFTTLGNRLTTLMGLMATGGLLVSNTQQDFGNVLTTLFRTALVRQGRFTLLPRQVLPRNIGGEEATPQKLPIQINSFSGA